MRDGQPDYAYTEQYVKAVMYRKYKKYNKYPIRNLQKILTTLVLYSTTASVGMR